jgi:plastocyanin
MRASIQVTIVALLAAVLVAAPASGGPYGRASKTTSVSVRDDLFSPRSKTVSRGDTVSWRWRRTDNPHNVRFRKVPRGARKGGSGTKSSGRFDRTFRKSGRYSYVCTIHENIGMTGSVRVR